MKIIKYFQCEFVDVGTEEQPETRQVLSAVTLTWSEANEAIARQEAHNGEYTIEDDGQPEPEPEVTPEERIAELEQALELLLSGVTE